MTDPCDKLHSILLGADSKCLERVAGFALGSLLGIPFRHARSGDQRGGDGGVSGIGGRHLVFESRRYGPNSRLDERSIRGEIAQAVERHPDLEAWILVTTKEVSEQLQNAIEETALSLGIAAVSVDWMPNPLPKLAALIASCPEHFTTGFGKQHGALLRQISELPGYTSSLQLIERELLSWSIGFDVVRNASHERVQEIWNSCRKSQAKFRQNVAGGDENARHVRRSSLIDHLDTWFESSDDGAVGALVGLDGVGKTWAALDWLQLRQVRLPIIVLAPSSTLGNADTTGNKPLHLIARYLHDISEVRDVSYWEKRVRRLLTRPAGEGPVFLLFFDGLNQLPSHDWPGILHQLEDAPFHQRVLTLISTRTTFFEDRLHRLGRLIASPIRVDVENYDLTPGGELDLKLQGVGLSRNDLPEHLLHHAAVPRMFDLIIRLRSELGDVGEVTVHRLLWAYGAFTIQVSSAGAFSDTEWRQFLLELAQDFKTGSLHSRRQRIETLSDSTTRLPDQVYHRVSSVIDGIFTTLDKYGEPEFDPDFVSHAVGLALVAQLDSLESGEQSIAILDNFLDPISGYDICAEILRAAVTIALLQNDSEFPSWLGTLCTRWLHSQNLPESHLKDLEVLAPELVTPLLDVIEASCEHSLTTPRDMAIGILATVDKSDSDVATTIAERGSRWQSHISLEKKGSETDRNEDSCHARRCKRLRERIGVDAPATITIAGREIQIVDNSDENLIVASAQLLQGRPLKNAAEFFVSGAIHHALVGSGAAQETQSWLNILNYVDPEETAVALRAASQDIRPLTPQEGQHPGLNSRIASILLWRTGYSEDAQEAWKTDPKIDHYYEYKKHYLSDPSRSFFRLERRHAEMALSDSTIIIFHRIERAKDALLDPSFQVPQDFVDELTSASRCLNFSQTATGRGRTTEDLQWEFLSLALARCNPDCLADCERTRLRQYAERTADQRFGSALAAPEAMLLVRSQESTALQTLREQETDETDDHELTIQTHLLIAEIQSASPVEQVMKILNSDIDPLTLNLGRACLTPSANELDQLIDLYGGDEQKLARLAIILAEHNLDLSQVAFETFLKLLFSNDTNFGSEATWALLGSNATERLGHTLNQIAWSWSCSQPHIVNIMGSKAIIASHRGCRFSDYAARIAPFTLLEALSQEERSPKEVRLAVDLLSTALSQYDEDAPESGLYIYHDYEATSTGNYNYTIGDIVEDRHDENDISAFIERVNNPEQYEQRRQAIIQSYFDAVRQARKSGALLLHTQFHAENFDQVLDHCPEAVDRWLMGMSPPTGEFRRRVRLAEGFYVGLCEALLRHDPSRGVLLWRNLRQCLTTTFIGLGGIDRLKYAPFIAPDCLEVESILEDLCTLGEAPTDEDLLNIVVAARNADRADWLQQKIFSDKSSDCPANRRRATFLQPLLTRPTISDDRAWPSGPPTGGYQDTREQAWIMGQREAFAAHWLQKFAEADTPEAAHASWLLFMASSDRRVKTWMSENYNRYAGGNEPIEAQKRRFVEQQKHRFKRVISDNEKFLKQNFTTQRTTNYLLPWREV